MLGDANSICCIDRVFSQHQVAVTLLNQKTSIPGNDRIDWIDIACGQGQVLVNIENSVSPQSRAKINFYPFDADKDAIKSVKEKCNKIKFCSVIEKVGYISDYSALYAGKSFDFITCTNCLHEFEPSLIPQLLIDIILSLKKDGYVYIFDMEALDPPELGAITWDSSDIQTILCFILQKLGVTHYTPEVSLWTLPKINVWSVNICKEHINDTIITDKKHIDSILPECNALVIKILSEKIEILNHYIHAFKESRPSSEKEKISRDNAVFKYWSIQDIIRGLK